MDFDHISKKNKFIKTRYTVDRFSKKTSIMAATWTSLTACFVIISLGIEITIVEARQKNPIVVPRGERKHFVNDHLYFIGKRNDQASRSRELLNDELRFTDEKISDAFLQVRAQNL